MGFTAINRRIYPFNFTHLTFSPIIKILILYLFKQILLFQTILFGLRIKKEKDACIFQRNLDQFGEINKSFPPSNAVILQANSLKALPIFLFGPCPKGIFLTKGSISPAQIPIPCPNVSPIALHQCFIWSKAILFCHPS